MSILSPSDPLNSDESGDRWFPPPPPPERDGVTYGLFDESRSQILAGVAGLVALALLGLVALTVLGSDDAETSNLSTLSQSLANTGEAETQAADGSALTGADAAGDPADNGAAEAAAAAAAAETESSAPTSAPSTTEAPTTTTPTSAPSTTTPTSPPSTTTPTSPPSTTTPTSPPSTTAAPTTAAPTTAAPTTAAPTTPAPTAAPTTPAPVGGDGPVQQQILNLVNAERANAGCGALTLNGPLNNAADAHSEDMYVNNYFDHTGLDGSKPWDRAARAGYGSSFIGENIAAGYGSAEAVMNGWMNSSGHRANILNCSYNHLGVGHSSGGNYWTQLFGGG